MSQPKPPAAKPRRARTPKNAFALPVRAAVRRPIPAFTPVPRQTYRHDGWTPERQRAFIAALADTGCVSRAARMVNMAQTNCYTLRRAPGAEEFRRAWDAALDCGLAQMKDIAFERAIEGELIPVFAGGKHDGLPPQAQRRAADVRPAPLRQGRARQADHDQLLLLAGERGGGGGQARGAAAGAEASHTTVTTVITGGGSGEDHAARQDKAAAAGGGVRGDGARRGGAGRDHGRARSLRATRAGAERRAGRRSASRGSSSRRRSARRTYLPLPHGASPYQGALEPPVQWEEA